RRRHTRSKRDWSSDVCSSDLSVRLAFAAQRVAEPYYWIASYDGDPTIPAGAIAKQYADPNLIAGHPHYDVSNVDSNFGGGGSQRSEERRVGKEWRARGWQGHA